MNNRENKDWPGLTTGQQKIYASLAHKKYRQAHGFFIAEGPHLVSEALKSGWPMERVIVESSQIELIETLMIPENLLAVLPKIKFDRLAASKTPQGVLAIVKTRDISAGFEPIIAKATRVVVADNISDPGNLGTMIRTAAAFDYDLFVCLGNCAEIYNPKTVRATQGALFTIPICEISSLNDFLKRFKPNFSIVAFTAKTSTMLNQIPSLERAALVFGSEADGITPELEIRSDWRVRIEQSERVESLNVAVAAGVGMYWGRGIGYHKK